MYFKCNFRVKPSDHLIPVLAIFLLFINGFDSMSADIENFCESATNRDFISIFNLGNNIIFQDTNKGIWKLNQTDIPRPNQKITPLYEKTIKRDKQMEIFLGQYFDLEINIVGLTSTPIDEENQCINATVEERKECLNVNSISSSHFTCLYGYKGTPEMQKIEAFIYEFSELKKIGSNSLKNKIQNYCNNIFMNRNLPQSVTNHTIGALQYYDYEPAFNYSLTNRLFLINPSLIKHKSNIFSRIQNGTDTLSVFDKEVSSDLFIYIFRYSQELGIFGCPLPCNIKSNLTRIIISEEDNQMPSFNKTNMSIEGLIRCPKYVTWKPNEFCNQNGFQSAFNLGMDIIFQNNGKFWRFMSSGANNFGNPYQDMNIQSIRFDSDMFEFLDQYFDTSQPIYGFTFKYIVEDLCFNIIENRDKCNEYFNQHLDVPYYRACIYGKVMEKLYFDEKGNPVHNQEVQAFYYVPLGLKKFESTVIESETRIFCRSILAKWTTANTMVTGMIADTFTAADGDNTLYVFVQDIKTKETTFHRTVFPRFFRLSNDLKWNQMDYSPNRHKRDGPSPSSMNYFPYFNTFVGFIKQNSSDKSSEESTFYLISEMSSRLDLDSFTFKSLNESLYSIYNCPFSQSYSVTYLEEEPLCTDFTGTYSVFQIGKNVYFQKGKRFYRAILTKNHKKLIFDKYFTDFMHDHFDTRQRVLGYSFPLNRFDEMVFIYGTTKHNYKSLGPHIFRTFKLERNSEIHPLRAINKPEVMFNSSVTFGINSEQLKYTRFKAMVYMDNGQEYSTSGTGPILADDYLGWLIVLVNETHLWFTSWKEHFEFPFEYTFHSEIHWDSHWKRLLWYQNTSSHIFTDLFGMFVRNDKIYATAWPPINEAKDEPIVVTIWDYRPTVNRTFFLNQFEPHKKVKFTEFFNCSESESESESESDEVGEEGDSDIPYFIFILILLFILMGCITALILWDKSQTEKETKKANRSKLNSEMNSNRSSSLMSSAPIQNANQKAEPKSSESDEQKTQNTEPLVNKPQNNETKEKSASTLQNNKTSEDNESVVQTRSDIDMDNIDNKL